MPSLRNKVVFDFGGDKQGRQAGETQGDCIVRGEIDRKEQGTRGKDGGDRVITKEWQLQAKE